MTSESAPQRIRVVCTDCHFSAVVEKVGETPATVIREHGRETGHKLTTEEVSTE